MNIDLILYLLNYFIISLILLILNLFLIEIGFWRYLYESIYTHPYYNRTIYVLGDTLYGLMISLVGAGIYTYLVNDKLLTKVFLYGIIGIILGAYIKHSKDS